MSVNSPDQTLALPRAPTKGRGSDIRISVLQALETAWGTDHHGADVPVLHQQQFCIFHVRFYCQKNGLILKYEIPMCRYSVLVGQGKNQSRESDV